MDLCLGCLSDAPDPLHSTPVPKCQDNVGNDFIVSTTTQEPSTFSKNKKHQFFEFLKPDNQFIAGISGIAHFPHTHLDCCQL